MTPAAGATLEQRVARLEFGVEQRMEDHRVLSPMVSNCQATISQTLEQVKILRTEQREHDGRLLHINLRLNTIEDDMAVLKTDVADLKTDVSGLKTDVAELKTDVSGLKTDMGWLKGAVTALLEHNGVTPPSAN